MPASFEKANSYHDGCQDDTVYSYSLSTCAISSDEEDDLTQLQQQQKSNHFSNTNTITNHTHHHTHAPQQEADEQHMVATCQQDYIPYDYDEALYEDEDEGQDETEEEEEEKAPEPFSPAWCAAQEAMAADRRAAARHAYTDRQTREVSAFQAAFYYNKRTAHQMTMYHIKALLHEACYEDLRWLRRAAPAAFADAVLPFFHHSEENSAARLLAAAAAAPPPVFHCHNMVPHSAAAATTHKLTIAVHHRQREEEDDDDEDEEDSLLSPTTLQNKNKFEKEKQHLVRTYERLQQQLHQEGAAGNAQQPLLAALKEVYLKAAQLQWRKVETEMDQYIAFLAKSLSSNTNNSNSNNSINNSNNIPLMKQKSTLLLSAISSMSLFQQQHILHHHHHHSDADSGHGHHVLVREAFGMKEVEKQCARRLQRSAQLLRDLKERQQLFVAPPAEDHTANVVLPPSPEATTTTTTTTAAAAEPTKAAAPVLPLLQPQAVAQRAADGDQTDIFDSEEDEEEGVHNHNHNHKHKHHIISANRTPETSYRNHHNHNKSEEALTPVLYHRATGAARQAPFQLPASSYFNFYTSFTNSTTNQDSGSSSSSCSSSSLDDHMFTPEEEEEGTTAMVAMTAAAAAAGVLSASNSFGSLDGEGFNTNTNNTFNTANQKHLQDGPRPPLHRAHPHPYQAMMIASTTASAENSPIKTYQNHVNHIFHHQHHNHNSSSININQLQNAPLSPPFFVPFS